MRGALLRILSGSMLAFGATAANATISVITCDPTFSVGCNASNPAPPAPATISWADADVGGSPFSGAIDFGNDVGGDYFVSLITADPNVFFTALSITPITGSGSIIYGGGPTHAISLLPGSLGVGTYHLSFSGTTSGGGGEGGTLSFTPAVPEPATWGMMLLGFAGIGMAMRRRRNPALAQIA